MNNPIQFGIIKKVNVDNRTVKIVCEQTSDIKKVIYIPTKTPQQKIDMIIKNLK